MKALLFTLSLIFFVSCLETVISQSSIFYLQVSHQAPTAPSVISVLLNGKSIDYFNNIEYGYGSSWINVNSYLGLSDSNDSDDSDKDDDTVDVTLTVVNTLGIQIYSENATLESGYQSFFLITSQDESSLDSFWYLTDVQPSTTKALLLFIDLSPPGPDGRSSDDFQVEVNGQTLISEFEYQDASEFYQGSSGIYVISVNNGNTVLASEEWQFVAGTITTIVFNGLYNSTVNGYQLFRVLDWQVVNQLSNIRAVQAVPGEKAYVWIGGIEMWQGIKYQTVTSYQKIAGMTQWNFYVSLTSEQPNTPALTANITANSAYSLLIDGNPDGGVPLQVQLLKDENYAPLYTVANVRAVYLSPDNVTQPTTVYINEKDQGDLLFTNSSAYTAVNQVPVNLTLVTNDEVVLYDNINAQIGNSYSFFVMGMDTSNTYPLTAVTAQDFGTANLTPYDDDDDTSDDEDDDDDDGLSGGAIAGIVIGVLFGVAIIGAIAYHVTRRKGVAHADYQQIPASSNFL